MQDTEQTTPVSASTLSKVQLVDLADRNGNSGKPFDQYEQVVFDNLAQLEQLKDLMDPVHQHALDTQHLREYISKAAAPGTVWIIWTSKTGLKFEF